MTFTIKTQILASSFDSCLELQTVTIDLLKKKDISFRDIKNALNKLNDIRSDEIYINRPYSDYDCTGQSFTTSLECIKKILYREEDTVLLIGMFQHHVSVDC